MNKRVSLGLDDDIDLSELIPKYNEKTSPMTQQQKDILLSEGAKHGFVSREPTVQRRRRVSPYTAQFGGKCRPAVKVLFQEAGTRMNCYDTITLEKAIEALLEKENYIDLLDEFRKIVK